MILRYGVSRETVDEWTTRVDYGTLAFLNLNHSPVNFDPIELNSLHPHMWCRFRFAWARRRAGEDLPAPPLPTNVAAAATRRSRPLYSSLETFHTYEEALTEWKRKQAAVGVWPTSAVQRASLAQATQATQSTQS